jgi:hypothetical protein
MEVDWSPDVQLLSDSRCLQLFIERNDDPWFFYPERKEGVWQILEQGLAHEDGLICLSPPSLTGLYMTP